MVSRSIKRAFERIREPKVSRSYGSAALAVCGSATRHHYQLLQLRSTNISNIYLTPTLISNLKAHTQKLLVTGFQTHRYQYFSRLNYLE